MYFVPVSSPGTGLAFSSSSSCAEEARNCLFSLGRGDVPVLGLFLVQLSKVQTDSTSSCIKVLIAWSWGQLAYKEHPPENRARCLLN